MMRRISYRRPRRRIRVVVPLIAGLLLLPVEAGLWAGEPEEDAKTPPMEQPSLELLDFIGSWVDDDGKWTDPAVVDQWQAAGKERSDDETD